MNVICIYWLWFWFQRKKILMSYSNYWKDVLGNEPVVQILYFLFHSPLFILWFKPSIFIYNIIIISYTIIDWLDEISLFSGQMIGTELSTFHLISPFCLLVCKRQMVCLAAQPSFLCQQISSNGTHFKECPGWLVINKIMVWLDRRCGTALVYSSRIEVLLQLPLWHRSKHKLLEA